MNGSFIKFLPDVPAFVAEDSRILEEFQNGIASNEKAVKVIANFLAQCSGRNDVYPRIIGKETSMNIDDIFYVSMPQGLYAKLKVRSTAEDAFDDMQEAQFSSGFYLVYIGGQCLAFNSLQDVRDFSGDNPLSPELNKYANGAYNAVSLPSELDVKQSDYDEETQETTDYYPIIVVNEFGIFDVINTLQSSFTHTDYQSSFALKAHTYDEQNGTYSPAPFELWEKGLCITVEKVGNMNDSEE